MIARPDLSALCFRQLRLLLTQPFFLPLFVIQPFIWLILYGQLFHVALGQNQPNGESYMAFLTPGVIIMTAFLGSIGVGLSAIADIDSGFVTRVLSSPSSRSVLPLSYALRCTVSALLSASLLLTAANLFVRVYPRGISGWLFLIFAIVAVASTAAFISLAVAYTVRRVESMTAAMHVMALPCVFLSSALLAHESMPAWMQTVSRGNPLDWGVRLSRTSMTTQETPTPLVLAASMALAVIGAMAIAHAVFSRFVRAN
jgi:ABC-2 type transport system permease protein